MSHGCSQHLSITAQHDSDLVVQLCFCWSPNCPGFLELPDDRAREAEILALWRIEYLVPLLVTAYYTVHDVVERLGPLRRERRLGVRARKSMVGILE